MKTRLSVCLSVCLLTTTTGGVRAQAPDIETLCKPIQPILDKRTQTPVGPIFLSRNSETGDIERWDVSVVSDKTSHRGHTYSGRYVRVEGDVVESICSLGYTVAALPREARETSAMKRKSGVWQQSEVPAAFTIVMYYGVVFGNFWVPRSMPWYHGAHIADFTVQGNNFQSANSGTHFVNTVTTVSSTSFASDFDAKGLYFGVDATFCGTSSSPRFVSVAETWTIQPGVVGNVNVWAGPTHAPDTCRDMPASETVRFLSGANRSQEYQYWRYDNGAATPTHQSGVVSSYDPNFRSGYAGVGFFVATFGSYYSEQWSLNFSNVSSYTL